MVCEEEQEGDYLGLQDLSDGFVELLAAVARRMLLVVSLGNIREDMDHWRWWIAPR